MVKIIRLLSKVQETESIESIESTESSIENIFSEDSLTAIASPHKYDKCGVKKISPHAFVHGFLEMFQEGKNCTRILSLKIGLLINDTIKKESLEDRFNRRSYNYVVDLLEKVMSRRVENLRQTSEGRELDAVINDKLGSKFNNVYIADSTCQAVPANLALLFPSSHNQAGNTKATMRLQVIYNYTAKAFSFFELGSFRDNDQSASDNIFNVAQPGDLVIRDLGYFALAVFALMTKQGIYFLSKYKYGVTVLDAQTKEKIDLLKFLRGKNAVDTKVKLGAKEQLEVRLIAHKLPELIANQRIAKAKAERHSKTEHSKEYYELLKWEIYITNVPVEILKPLEIKELYTIRWFIEIIFKTWKSHFNFKKILNTPSMSYYRALITIVLMLTKITYSFTHLFCYIDEKVQKEYNLLISPLKFMDLINSLWTHICKAKTFEDIDYLIPQFAAHGTYERRKDRKNMREKRI
jgi:Transposase DDE domain